MATNNSPQKATRRRRRLNVPGGRSKRVDVWVTSEERAMLEQRAVELGVTVPRVLVEGALRRGGAPSAGERQAQITELFAHLRTLNGMAVNINQLAKHANAEGRLPVGTREALEAIAHAVDGLNELLDEVAGA